MECTVRRPVPAIRTAACGESTDGSGIYQPDRHVSTRSHNATAVSHPQGCPDQRTHGAGSGVPRALGLRPASDSSDDCRKESHAGSPGDTYNANGQTDTYGAEDSHSEHSHCDSTGNASE